MRRVFDEQTYLDFSVETSLKVVQEYRAKYAWIDECLEANPLILWLVHEDLETLSQSQEGREAKYTTEILFRALLVHQIEKTSLRGTVIRMAESSTLESFIRLGTRSVPDFTFLNRAFKAMTAETGKLINEELAHYAVKQGEVDVSQIRADTTVIEANIHYPTDSSLPWDSYRAVSPTAGGADGGPRAVPASVPRQEGQEGFGLVHRYLRSGSKARQRELKRRFRHLHGSVCRLERIAAPLLKSLAASERLVLQGLGAQLKHYLPLVRKVCRTAERAALKGETVPARDRIFSLFEEHTELIKRGKSHQPVEFGHAVWLAQSRSKFITDYEVMEEKIPDSELLGEITERHKATFRRYPEAVTADTGFRAAPEEMSQVQMHVATLAVPGRGQSHATIDTCWHHFRAGIEGSISVLKRAFRLSICMYRGFKSFGAAVGMAVFCHNLVNLVPKRAPT